MELFSIGEVAEQTGLAPSTLRYYEQIGLLPSPPRHNGRRRYDREALPHIRLIQAGRAAGLTIADLKKLVASQPLNGPLTSQSHQLITHKITAIEQTIQQLQAWQEALAEWQNCGCDPLQNCAKIN